MEFQKSHSSLQENPLLDGLDRRLVHALQVHPRVAWVDLGCVLAVDPAQLSRRWARLVREGAAWTSCYPGLTARGSGGDSAALALIELTVTGGERDAVIDELGALPEIFSLECTSGSRDLLATVVRESVGEVDRFIGRSVATLPHVTGTRTHFVRRIFLSGSKWELGGLDTHERQQLRLQRFGEGAPLAAPTALHRRVMAELYADVRIPASEIARRLDKSVTTISKAISDLLRAPCARVHRRCRRHGAARRPVRLRRLQHRGLRLLIRSLRSGPGRPRGRSGPRGRAEAFRTAAGATRGIAPPVPRCPPLVGGTRADRARRARGPRAC